MKRAGTRTNVYALLRNCIPMVAASNPDSPKADYTPTGGVVDPYSYRGSWVLKNAFGIRDRGELELLEGTLSAVRAGEGMPAGNFDYAHLKSIHRHRFQDLYDWAGDERTIVTAKRANQSAFPAPGKIAPALDQTFAQLKADNDLKGLTQPQFAEKVATLLLDINAAHPFREGNGRSMREFANLVANDAGYEIDWAAVDKDRWNEASVAHSYGNSEPMQTLMTEVVVTLEQAQAPDSLVNKLGRKAYTAAQLKTLYPELIAVAQQLALQEQVEQAEGQRRQAAHAFLRLPPDKAVGQFPGLSKHYAIWDKAKVHASERYGPGSASHTQFLETMKRRLVYGIIGVPDPERKTHDRPTERGPPAEPER
ncbi:MAG: hypothetical protein GY814_07965 [Gammaproteobacteria bacterium]|nr:hypothetical protein [Gammaproteobacteria bacterium]